MLSYGLSSEYLTSTKEAKAKSKTIDADRSLYRCAWTLEAWCGKSDVLPCSRQAATEPSAPCAPSCRSRYYVQSLLKLDEEALHAAWCKVCGPPAWERPLACWPTY